MLIAKTLEAIKQLKEVRTAVTSMAGMGKIKFWGEGTRKRAKNPICIFSKKR